MDEKVIAYPLELGTGVIVNENEGAALANGANGRNSADVRAKYQKLNVLLTSASAGRSVPERRRGEHRYLRRAGGGNQGGGRYLPWFTFRAGLSGASILATRWRRHRRVVPLRADDGRGGLRAASTWEAQRAMESGALENSASGEAGDDKRIYSDCCIARTDRTRKLADAFSSRCRSGGHFYRPLTRGRAARSVSKTGFYAAQRLLEQANSTTRAIDGFIQQRIEL
jgi:hypothetical protein